MTSKEMVKTACNALSEKKSFDIKVLDIRNISDVADYFVIADGTNKNQVQAMCDSVEEFMLREGQKTKSIEGYSQGGWILLDYYDIIVHIFSDESRRFYNIERIWNDAVDVTSEFV
jgi:ribosome-associated protein